MNLFKVGFFHVLRRFAGSLVILSLVLAHGCSGGDDGPDQSKGASFRIGENANMPSGGTITSQYSDSPEGSDISKIIDNDKSTEYVTSHSSFYISWEGDISEPVSSYSLTSGDGPAVNDPLSWRLSGSRDGSNWILLDTRSDQQFDGRQATKSYSVDNQTRYKYYKLEILANNGGSSTGIAEWSIRVPDQEWDISDLIAAYSWGSTYSAKTPMGTNFNNASNHTTTDEDRKWLDDPECEPILHADWVRKGFSMQPFDVMLFPFGDPSPADVNQNSLGNCAGLTTLAALAYMNPDFIKGIVTDNGDKTYSVAMFDPQGQPVQVSVSNKFMAGTNLSLGQVSGKGKTATWATVIDKAVMKYLRLYMNRDIGGVKAEEVSPMLTGDGRSYGFKPGVLSTDEIYRVVQSEIRQGKLVTGGFSKGSIVIPNAYKGKDVMTTGGHWYSIVLSTDDNALFTMRNPWGWNYGVTDSDGLMNIPNIHDYTKLVDLRIMEPGIAAGGPLPGPYYPPL